MWVDELNIQNKSRVRELALKNRVKVDELKIQHKARVREFQLKHVVFIDSTKRDITQLQNHGNELMEKMYDMADEVGGQQKVTRNASKSEMVFPSLHDLG